MSVLIYEDGFKAIDYETNVFKSFQRLYEDQIMTDCTLIVGGSSIKAHKVILSATCPYFEEKFLSTDIFDANHYPLIIFNDITFLDLKYLLHYMYYGEIQVPKESMTSLLKAAVNLKMVPDDDAHSGLKVIADNGDCSGIQPEETKKRHQTGEKITDTSNSETRVVNRDDIPPTHHNNGFRNDNQAVVELESDNSNDSVSSPEELPASPSFGHKAHQSTSVVAQESEPSEEDEDENDEDDDGDDACSTLSGNQSSEATDVVRRTRGFSKKETEAFVRAWDIESQKAVASGSLILSRGNILSSLRRENIFKSESQMVYKFKQMKNDFAIYKNSGQISSSIAPHMEVLKAIYSRLPHKPRRHDACPL